MKRILVVILTAFVLETRAASVWTAEHVESDCPKECFCQTAPFSTLSVSRWIGMTKLSAPHEDLLFDKEQSFVDEEDLTDPITKQATCIFQPNTDINRLLQQLPIGLQSLVILYNEIGRNLTVMTSSFTPLNQLSTLEIRGYTNSSFKLVIDVPLDFLVNANFESIQLESSALLKRPKNPGDLSKSFDYVPSSEKFELAQVATTDADTESEILPYDIYLIELKKSRLPSFNDWKSLEVLRIHGCNLDELYWEMFDGLSALQHLSLEYNDIQAIHPFALYGALHIKTLSLAHNRIPDLHYRALAGLLDLEVLDLTHNKLTKLSELTFPPFPKLESVDFRHNPIQTIFPATFGVMNRTQTMFLGCKEMELDLINNEAFESLNMLEELSITNMTINSLNKYTFGHLKQLEILEIHGRIDMIEFDAFADLEKLRVLNLSHCNIQKVSMDAFFGSVSLDVIDMSNNGLNLIPPDLFNAINVKEIYLQNNNLENLPKNFFSIATLTLVRLSGNPWQCTCDMVFWDKQKTNRVVKALHENKSKETKRGSKSVYLTQNQYTFDNKVTPRCKNHNDRSLYYVLRQDLQCKIPNSMKKRTNYAKNIQNKRQRKKEKQLQNFETKFSYGERAKKSRRINNLEQFSRNKINNDKSKYNLNSLNVMQAYLSLHNNPINDADVLEPLNDYLDAFNTI